VDNALIQSRLTLLGFTLAFLIFLVNFLGAAVGLEARAEGDWVIPVFFWSYLNTFAPIVLGFLLCLTGVMAFLRAQAVSSRDWYDYGQIALFLALSQALSGFNEVTVRVVAAATEHSRDHQTAAAVLAWTLALLSQILWLALLYAPFAILRERSRTSTPAPRRLWLAYWAALGIVFILPGIGFYLRDPGQGRLDNLLGKIAIQPFRPLSWLLKI
jgi:hypothetical protein